MNPIPKPLAEIVKEEWALMETFSDSLKIYAKGNQRLFYDSKNEQVLWSYQSDLIPLRNPINKT